MKKRTFVIVCLLLALILSGCGGKENGITDINEPQLVEPSAEPTREPTPESTPEPTPEPTPSPEDIAFEAFEAAMSEYTSSEAYKITLEVNTTRKRGEESIKELLEETINFENVQSEDFCAYVTDRISLQNDLTVIECDYLYSDGKVYSPLNEFYTEMDANGFMAELYPAVLVTPEFYKAIVYDEASGKIFFSEPSQAEKWLDVGEGTLVSANAEISLEDGKIKQTFDAEYVVGDVSVSIALTSCVMDTDGTVDIGQKLDGIDPNWLCTNDMRAFEYWARTIYGFDYSPAQTCTCTDDVYIGYIDFQYTEISEQNCYGTGENLVFHTLFKRSGTYQGNDTEYKIDMQGNGELVHIQVDEREPYAVYYGPGEVNGGANLSEYMMGWTNMSVVEVTEDDTSYIFGFECTDGYDTGYLIQKTICNTLFEDEDYIDNVWPYYETVSLGGKMKIDKVTLLPLEYVLEYQGHYEMSEFVWAPISLVNKIEMDMLSETAFDALLEDGHAMERNSTME